MSAPIDNFSDMRGGVTGPAERLFAITPDNSTDLAYVTRGLYVGVSGNVAVHDVYGTATTLVGLAAGVFHPIRVRRVLVTGTTVTGIVGAY